MDPAKLTGRQMTAIGAPRMKTLATTASPPRTSVTRPSVTERTTSRRSSFLPVLFIVSLLIPIFFHVGEVRLAPFLIVLVMVFLPLLVMWLDGQAGPRILPDYLIAFSCLWATLALFHAQGLGASLEPAGVIWIQTFGSYLLGRMFVRSTRQLQAVALVYGLAVLALLPFAVFESLTSRPLYLEIFSHLGSTYDATVMDARWGLTRVQGAFEHPILFGIFVTSLFALVFYQVRHAKWRLILLLALPAIVATGFLSLSTGALLCLFVQFGLIAWDWIFKNHPKRWQVLMMLVVAGYVMVDLLSDRTPFHVFVDYLTFNSGSAYNRILIWQYGSAEVWRHPFFGIGLGDWIRPWWMSPSMDNFWLVIAVRYGMPAFLALAAAILIIVTRVGKAGNLDQTQGDLRTGLVISIIGLLVAIGSVHLWNASFTWLMFLIGSAVWLTDASLLPKPANSEVARSKPRTAAVPHRPVSSPRRPPLYSPNAARAASSLKRRRTLFGGDRA